MHSKNRYQYHIMPVRAHTDHIMSVRAHTHAPSNTPSNAHPYTIQPTSPALLQELGRPLLAPHRLAPHSTEVGGVSEVGE